MKLSQIALYTDADGRPAFTGAEAIRRMFGHTDENGVLYFPAWRRDADWDYPTRPSITKCVMRWDRADAEAVAAAYDALYGALRKIAPRDTETDGLPADLQAVRDTYLRPLDGGVDYDRIVEISERVEANRFANGVAARIRRGADVTAEEKERYFEVADVSVTEEERALYDAYCAALDADAARRIGDRPAAYEVVIRAQRLCKLFALRAPAAVIETEALYLAQAMAVHEYAESVETAEAENE